MCARARKKTVRAIHDLHDSLQAKPLKELLWLEERVHCWKRWELRNDWTDKTVYIFKLNIIFLLDFNLHIVTL